MSQPIYLFWFRRDLRLQDNTGLFHALSAAKKMGVQVLPIFIFDKNILEQLDDKEDRRVDFIHQTLTALQDELVQKDKTLWVHYGTPESAFKELSKKFDIKEVYTNHDYEPYALERDEAIKQQLAGQGIGFHTYSNKWKAAWEKQPPVTHASEKGITHLLSHSPFAIPSLTTMGFKKTDLIIPSKKWNEKTVMSYTDQRNFPSVEGGTSHLGMHLRFGTISIRQLAMETKDVNTTYFNELIWRDFYHMILSNFPQVGKGKSFKAQYDFIEWRNNENEFEAWCQGKTGYPIVDAGMRELNTTGFMHNRVRMIVASFLTKHLLIDWRWGEAYFAQKLLDFDLAANNGGWQWASGSGCDAAPYFRVFNPRLQTEKFDKQLKYIRKWVPELESFEYPKPIVVHEEARVRVLATYAKALKDV